MPSLVCVCGQSGGRRRVQDAALVRSGVLRVGDTRARPAPLGFEQAARTAGDFTRPPSRIVSSGLGFAFARVAAPLVVEAALPAISGFLGLSRYEGGDGLALEASDVGRAGVSSSELSQVAVACGPDVCGAGGDGGSICSTPAPGRAGYTIPFIGRVCGNTVWIRQSASLGLPNELLFAIFSYSSGRYVDTEPSRHAHYQSLLSVAGTCRHWYDYVGCCGGLWSSFTVTPHRLAASLNFWLSRIHRAPLDLQLSFDDLFALYHPRSTARAPRLGVRDTILRVAPALSQCARLSIDADSSSSYPLLMEKLSIASGHMLVSLSITRVYFAFLDGVIPPMDPTPNLFFRTGVPVLRFLRLCNATVGWGNLGFFERLEVLTLWGMHCSVGPTAVQLYAILAFAQLLVRLSLRQIECAPLPPGGCGFIALPCLVELDLHLSGTLGLPDTLNSTLDVCWLARVVVLSLQVSGVSREVLSDLWSLLPVVEELDLSSSGVVAFDALYSAGGPYDSSNHCPRLSCLTVRNVHPSDMKMFLQRRTASGLVVRRLTMFQVVDYFESSEADISWIADHVGPDAFCMDPDRERSCLEFISRWSFGSVARPEWCLRRSVLPTELWTLILLEICLTSRTARGFNVDRDNLRCIWEDLDFFVMGVAAFWTNIHVDLSTDLESLVASVAASKLLSLDVTVDLRTSLADWELGTYLDLDPRQLKLLECLEVLKSVSSRWRSVRCQVNRELYLETARDFMESSSAPALACLDIDSAVADLRADVQVFRNALPNLRRLRVSAFPIGWIPDAGLGCLTSLEICGLSALHFPTVTLFAALLEGVASTLKALVLAGMGFCDDSPLPPTPFPMPVLESVNIAFLHGVAARDNMVVSFLAVLDLPSLRSFILDNAGDESTTNLASALPFLRNITSLTVFGGYAGYDPTRLLLGVMAGLTSIDIRMASFEFVGALSVLPSLLPKLSVMRFNALDASIVVDYLRMRKSMALPPMRALHGVQDQGLPLSPSQVVSLGELSTVVAEYTYSESGYD
ncbi:hypothetical protein C8F04DRAFT_1255102 [Mycena alexandri]|uniref:F-box domain-containing protein n=1 Tax=Mycena alexandri TaxID=1745969 RepID=A0AAD6X7D9_9AGAR|nr:hypothetical protein C8F04DRAFT_1255102 [Mycena alexandri]